MFKKILIPVVFATALNASTNIEKSWLEKQPRSYEKDFYISLYLKQNISSDDAIWALGQAKRVNNKLLYPYAKALNNKDTTYTINCMKAKTKDLLNKDATCIRLGLKLYESKQFTKNQLNTIINKVKPLYPKYANELSIMNSDVAFFDLIKSDNKTFFDIFNNCGVKFRIDNFNHHLPTKLLKRLSKNKYRFYSMVKLITTTPQLDKLQESLLHVDASNQLHKTQFMLAINAIKHHKKKIALDYLKLASKSAYYKFDKDKVLFWQYQLTNDKQILKKLSSSWSNNIYSLYAKEKLNTKILNLKYDSKNKVYKEDNVSTNDPFYWLGVLKDIKSGVNKTKREKYQNIFTSKKTSGYMAYVDEKYYGYKKTFLPNPYEDILSQYPKNRQVLINALAKQESRFIPSSLSSSYAMGVMQIMPFLSNALAKELKEPYNILDQLKAPINIKYANKHLNYLESKLDHVLFIAYAYNGGIGFTNRKVLKAGLFQKGPFEPYLSMELVPYDESKKYGKKVLVNYYFYNQLINNDYETKFSTLINSIKNPYFK